MLPFERLRKTVEAIKVDVADATVVFTVSIGVAVLEDEDNGLDDIVNRADKAMYQAKSKGRNRVVMLHAGRQTMASAGSK